ncbi:glycosyltransferase family 2 protein [Bacillus siamensis]|uniref:glycosyltransferase family 2 protein n=1 Tax=Bacillus siamensis TaxID=659243 RepID=UPI002E1CF3DF|nr:glycosyltransferase family 2 protein [Bacillus siamensis]MED0777476.1 glycosyltransferase family 2 protein [Bacillus siamensis]MED0781000.1 glycosyltransferase family 2 protein [Bacillus siamensis]MED0835851.1 glycosyltransferase family 2 protein [Bacillus siamensis]
MEKKISIILTSYNKPDLVKQAIESVLQQTYSNWELFVMDDHSNEETSAAISTYIKDHRIYYYNSFINPAERLKSTRYAVLINDALSRVKGEYVTYLTDDTVYHPDRLSRMAETLNQCTEFDAVYSSQKVVHVNERGTEQFHFYRFADDVLDQAAFLVDHCSVMHRKSLLRRVKEKYGSFWDEDVMHWNHGDSVFWSRLNTFTSFLPIKEVLDTTYKTPHSFQNTYQSLPSELVDGSFVKGTDQKVYQLDRNKRKLVNERWRPLYEGRAVVIPDPFLFQYEEENAAGIPNFQLVTDQCHIYFVEDGTKRLIDLNAFRFYRFKRPGILALERDEIQALPDGPPIRWERSGCGQHLPGRMLFRIEREFYVYLRGVLHPISQDVVKRFFANQKAVPISFQQIKQLPIGKPFYPMYDEIIRNLNITKG